MNDWTRWKSFSSLGHSFDTKYPLWLMNMIPLSIVVLKWSSNLYPQSSHHDFHVSMDFALNIHSQVFCSSYWSSTSMHSEENPPWYLTLLMLLLDKSLKNASCLLDFTEINHIIHSFDCGLNHGFLCCLHGHLLCTISLFFMEVSSSNNTLLCMMQ